MKLSIMTKYPADEDGGPTEIAVEYLPGETVEQLVSRCFYYVSNHMSQDPGTRAWKTMPRMVSKWASLTGKIEIKLIDEEYPEVEE